MANAGLSFVVEPLGEVSYTTKYAANAVLVLGVLVLLFWARRCLLEAVPAQGGPLRRVGTEVRGSVSQQVAD